MDGKLAALLAGQDQEDLAAKVAVSPETCRRWLNGEALPYRRILPAIAVATGIPIESLRIARRTDRAAQRAISTNRAAEA